MLSLFRVLICFCRVRRFYTTNLIKIIISISLCISMLFYRKFGSVLALIWILVYLGGMMVCFVYVLFIISSDIDISQKIGRPTSIGSMLFALFPFFILLKGSIIKSWNLHTLQYVNWRSTVMLFREIYSQIISQSPLFFLISSMVLLFALLQVLSMLNLKNKTRVQYLL